jgi:hypothetical protein
VESLTLFATPATALKTQAGGNCVEGFDTNARCASVMASATMDAPSTGPGQESHAGVAGAAAGAGADAVDVGFDAQPLRAARRTTAVAPRTNAGGGTGDDDTLMREGSMGEEGANQ